MAIKFNIIFRACVDAFLHFFADVQPFVLNGTLNQNNGNYFYMLNVLENQNMLSVRISLILNCNISKLDFVFLPAIFYI